MAIQYKHENRGKDNGKSHTYALRPPSKGFLQQLVTNHLETVPIDFGFSRVNAKDQYNKSVGRSVAEGKIAPRTCEFAGMTVEKNRHIYWFRYAEKLPRPKNELRLTIGLSVVDHAEDVHFHQAYTLSE